MTTARERRARIVELVELEKIVEVSALAVLFGVTGTSIRRDLHLIEEQGHLKRVHGGAVAGPRSPRRGAYTAKEREHLDEKGRIASAAAALVAPGDVVLFDSGTTVARAAFQIAQSPHVANTITAVTHSLLVMEEIASWPSPNLVCLGGLLLRDYQAFVGPQTLTSLRELYADIVFLGCDGLTVEQGITTPHVLVAEVGAMMASRARRVVALADSSKLARSGFTPIVPISAVDLLITDNAADPKQVARIREAGCEVRLA